MWLQRLIRFFGLWSKSLCSPQLYGFENVRTNKTTNHTIWYIHTHGKLVRYWIGVWFRLFITYVFTHTFTLNSIWNRRKPVCAITCCLIYHGVVFGYTYFQMQHKFGTTNELLICSSDHLDPQNWNITQICHFLFLTHGLKYAERKLRFRIIWFDSAYCLETKKKVPWFLIHSNMECSLRLDLRSYDIMTISKNHFSLKSGEIRGNLWRLRTTVLTCWSLY